MLELASNELNDDEDDVDDDVIKGYSFRPFKSNNLRMNKSRKLLALS
jgi:hypothetical protein